MIRKTLATAVLLVAAVLALAGCQSAGSPSPCQHGYWQQGGNCVPAVFSPQPSPDAGSRP